MPAAASSTGSSPKKFIAGGVVGGILGMLLATRSAGAATLNRIFAALILTVATHVIQEPAGDDRLRLSVEAGFWQGDAGRGRLKPTVAMRRVYFWNGA